MSRFFACVLGLSWLALLGVVDAAVFVRADLVGRTLDDALSEVFVSSVDPGDADLRDGVLEIRGARLMRPDEPGLPYATIGSIRVTPDWTALLALKTKLVKIVVEDVRLHVAWDDDGALDMPSPFRTDVEPSRRRDARELPRVEIRGLSFELVKCPWLVDRRASVAFPEFEVALRPDGSEHWLYRFAATLGGGVLGDLDAEGRIGVDDFVLSLRREGFRPKPELIETLRPEFAAILRDVRLDGAMRFSAELSSGDPADKRAFTARLDLDGVSAAHRSYGLELADLRGRVVYKANRVTAEALTASFEGGFLEVGGYVDANAGADTPPVFVEGKLSGLVLSSALGDRVATLPDPCPTVGEQIRQWDPRGVCDVRFKVEQKRLDKGAGGAVFDLPRPKIDVEFRGGANVAFLGGVKDDGERRGFAYRLEDVRGVLQFTDLGMNFDGVTAKSGPLFVEARGAIGYEKENDETYDVDVTARDLPLDGKVAEALSEPGRSLFESLDAEGRVDLRVAVKRQKGEPPGPRLVVDADLLGVKLEPRPFPLPVEDVRGQVRIDDDRISILALRGRHRGGVIRVFDSFLGQSAESDAFRIVAEAEALPVGESLRRALSRTSPEAAKALDRLGVEGIAGGKTTVLREAGKATVAKGYVEFQKTSLRSDDPPFRATDGVGAVEFDGERIRIAQGTRARFADQPVAISGTAEASGAFDLVFEGARPVATPRLWSELEVLSPKFAPYASPPLFLGPFEFDVRLKSDGATTSAEVRRLSLNGVTVALPENRGTLEDARAVVAIDAEGAVSATDISFRVPWPTEGPDRAYFDDACFFGESSFSVTCAAFTYVPPKPGETVGSTTFGPGTIRFAPLCPWLYRLFGVGPEIGESLRRARIHGLVDLDFASVRRSREGAFATGLSVAARKFMVGDSVDVDDLELTGRRGADRRTSLGFEAVIDADGRFSTSCEVAILEGRVFDIPLSKLRASLKLGSYGFELSNVAADVFGYRPRLEGASESAPAAPVGRTDDEATRASFEFESGVFGVAARLVDVDVAEIVRKRGGDPGAVRGTLSCTFDLTGVSGAEETYRGSAKARADLRKAVDLPFFFQLFKRLDVLTIFQSSDPPTKVSATFRIADRLISSSDVEVDARDVVLRGAARLRFDGYMRADLDASYAAGILPWTWVMSALSGALAPGVVIEGPLKDLQIRVESAKPKTPLPPEAPPESRPESRPADAR